MKESDRHLCVCLRGFPLSEDPAGSQGHTGNNGFDALMLFFWDEVSLEE